ASDVTSLIEAQQQAETERQNALMILNLLNKKQQIARFIRETNETFSDLKKALDQDSKAWDGEAIFRALHTIKGGSASFNVMNAAHAAHEAENRLAAWQETPSEENASSLRAAALEVQNSYGQFLEETKRILGPAAFSEERLVEMLASEVRTLCNQIGHWAKGQSLAENLRRRYLMEPASSFFEPYNDVMARVAEVEGKSVSPIVFTNGQLPLLPEAYSHLFATFVHAFRNAVDHGLEHPSVRVEKGKPESGKVEVSFEQLDGVLRIQVVDDGAGIDPLKIRTRLEGRGIEHRHESDEQVIQHVFDSSFSTRDQVSETSGRGVGMDAIKVAAEALGGKVHVTSTVGKGTCLTVEVPWVEDLKSEAYPRIAS
ncbi:MAG: Hpt domain-containing protein, partial [Bdellovibrionaceae bacterium]|nr:Hpt domain-containing protein [Pseudobdellovibrionaceae bacterium]